MKPASALACFTVQHRRLRLRIRLLATVADVDAAFREGRRRQKGLVVHGFFEPAGARARHVGTIVIPCAGADLMEIIPHEVTHAVMQHMGDVNCAADEALATSVGVITSRIIRQMARRGLGDQHVMR